MIHIFKNLNFGGLLALVAGVVLMVSWKNHETKKSAAFQWYEISIIDLLQPHDQPSNQRVEGLYPGGEPSESGDCSETDPNSPLCASELELPSSVSFPITMKDVEDNNYLQGDTRHKEE